MARSDIAGSLGGWTNAIKLPRRPKAYPRQLHQKSRYNGNDLLLLAQIKHVLCQNEGYRAALRRDRIGLGFSVFIGVKIDGHANERALQFEKAIVAMPEIMACHLVSGEADYFLEVVVPELGDYQRFLVDKLLNMPIVRDVRSNIAIQTLKAGAALPLGHLEQQSSKQGARPRR